MDLKDQSNVIYSSSGLIDHLNFGAHHCQTSNYLIQSYISLISSPPHSLSNSSPFIHSPHVYFNSLRHHGPLVSSLPHTHLKHVYQQNQFMPQEVHEVLSDDHSFYSHSPTVKYCTYIQHHLVVLRLVCVCFVSAGL